MMFSVVHPTKSDDLTFPALFASIYIRDSHIKPTVFLWFFPNVPISSWWLTYPPEKSWSSSMWDYPIYEMENKSHV